MQQDNDGRTALMQAAERGSLGCLKALLPLSDVHQVNKDGHSALDLASNPDCRALIQQRILEIEAQREAKHLESQIRVPIAPQTPKRSNAALGRSL
jgi:ankyrin repeat protein